MKRISKKELINILFSKHRFGIKPGLERTMILSEALDSPHKKFKSIHIAGTNGKGSVASLLSSAFVESGYKVGLYTSPHILDFNERIRINGRKIGDDEIAEIYMSLHDKSEEISATFFEITTIMTFQYFATQQVDIAIIETGMGGRFDSTNIINPILSIITDIDMDHKEYLGDTIDSIAFEKAGIIKKNIPVICSDMREDRLKTIKNKANELNSKLYLVSENISPKNAGGILISSAFIKNYSTFQKALEIINKSNEFKVVSFNNKIINNLSKNSGYYGRMEIINKDLPIIIDVAHNQAAIKNLIETTESNYPNKEWDLVFTLMKDKELDSILNLLDCTKFNLYSCKANIERSFSADEIMNKALEKGIKCESIDSIQDFIRNKNFDKATMIFGSFYLIAEIYDNLKMRFI